MDKKRLLYVDYAKGYGMLMIVLGHVGQCFPASHQFISYFISYHVPLFFIISGVLVAHRNREEKWGVFISKKYHSLVIPYIYFSLFNSALKLSVLAIAGKLTTDVFKTEMIDLLILGNGTVWFLSALFGAEVLFWLIRRNHFLMIVVACIGLLISFTVGSPQSPVVCVVIRILAALSFYVFGYYLGTLVLVKSTPPLYVGGLLLLAGIFSYIYLDCNYSFFAGDFFNPVATLSTILLNSCGCIFIFKHIHRQISSWTYIGKNSLIIMLVHPTLLLLFTYPLVGILGSLSYAMQWVICMSLFVVIVLLQIPFINLINNRMPFLIGKKKNIN